MIIRIEFNKIQLNKVKENICWHETMKHHSMYYDLWHANTILLDSATRINISVNKAINDSQSNPIIHLIHYIKSLSMEGSTVL